LGTPALDGILERNRAFVRQRSPQPLPPPHRRQLAVVACYDPRLDALLLPALGLEAGDAFLLRTAGALVQAGSGSLRSLALAIYMFDVAEVLVLGHSSCRMASFEASTFIDAFRARGVARAAFGAEDLRTWAGAIPSPRRGVEISMANVRSAPFVPRDLVVRGAVLDDATGALELVAAETAPAAEDRGTADAATPLSADAARAAAADPSKPSAPEAPDPLAAAAERFVRVVKSKARWRAELPRLRQELDRTSSPVAKLRAIESFARRAGAESSEILAEFERLRREVTDAEREPGGGGLGRLLPRLVRNL
jgi:carbonic anhydrase